MKELRQCVCNSLISLVLSFPEAHAAVAWPCYHNQPLFKAITCWVNFSSLIDPMCVGSLDSVHDPEKKTWVTLDMVAMTTSARPELRRMVRVRISVLISYPSSKQNLIAGTGAITMVGKHGSKQQTCWLEQKLRSYVFFFLSHQNNYKN